MTSGSASQGRDRYRLDGELARGGMGVVFRAHDMLARRDVAFKRPTLHAGSSRARQVTLFKREYDTLARLAHPNIVEVYDYGWDDDGPFYAMELLAGTDLAHLAPLPWAEACRALRGVASALALIHARRLIHRDISPGNVRLTSDGRAKLIDFGALMSFGRPSELVGTPACIAPECLDDTELDQRSDLYSLGAVAYWALTRRLAVHAQRLTDLPAAWNHAPSPPSAYVPELPKELDELVLSLLARDPRARPATAAHVIERLTAIAQLEEEPDEAVVAASYLARPPLVGRAATTAFLDQALVDAQGGQGCVVSVEAESGLGRSALLDDFALRAQLAGAIVVRAQGYAGEVEFGVASRLVQHAIAIAPDLKRVGHASVAPRDAGSAAPQSAVDVAARQAIVIRSAIDTLLALSADEPLVIIVDDAQLADAASLATLAALARALAGTRLLLLVTIEESSIRTAPPALLYLRDVARSVPLLPLQEHEVDELAQLIFGAIPNCQRLGRWLQAQSGGNPAHLMDLARTLLQTRVIRYQVGTFMLPHDVATSALTTTREQSLLSRLANLPDTASRVATAACIDARGLQREQLADMLAQPLPDVQRALELLVARAIFTRAERGFTFASELLRTALLSRLGAEERCTLHLAAARALLAHPTDQIDSQLAAADHLIEGGAHNEGLTLLYKSARRAAESEACGRWVPLLEKGLALHDLQKRSDEESLVLLRCLVSSAFFGDPSAQTRHVERTLAVSSRICGLTLSKSLRSVLGGKLALVVGMIYAAVRHALIPKHRRLGNLREMLTDFMSTVGMATASAASAFDSLTARRLVAWLKPLDVLPPTSLGALVREFCIATSEVSTGDYVSSSARYAKLQQAIHDPALSVTENFRHHFLMGCYNGRAQAEAAALASPLALTLADGLQANPFFAPHAECARIAYYGYRGLQRLVDIHRERAEACAMRGGTSWSAVTVLTVRLGVIAILTRDALGLVRVIAELERLSGLAPKLVTFKAICEAWLAHLRGRSDDGLTMLETVSESPDARQLNSWRLQIVMRAALLNALGRHQRANEVALQGLAQLRTAAGTSQSPFDEALLLTQVALAEAGRGDIARASAMLDAFLVQHGPDGNALLLGGGHRDRASVALLAGDREGFKFHFAEMQRYFEATENVALLQQRDALKAAGQRLQAHGETHAQLDAAVDVLDLDTALSESLP